MHIALTVDIVVFGYAPENIELKVLLIKRGIEPYKNSWALPGGFVLENETLEQAAIRELKEEAGVSEIFLEQLYTFGAIHRDPRERVVSVAYFALVNPHYFSLHASTDASDAQWYSLDKVPKLAFDHREILGVAVQRLRAKFRYEPIGFELLPEKFTLTQLQVLYETVLDTKLDKRNFRKKILSFEILQELDAKVTDVPYRAPTLYCFNKKKYQGLLKKGLKYEI